MDLMETEKDLISVIIPTYNRAGLISKAIRSALEQTGRISTEILVVDDGSTDGTAEEVQGFPESSVRYIRAPHAGACAARNRGIREARGEYIAFLDSDDAWHPDKLEKQKALLEKTGADAIACALTHHETDTGREFIFPDRTTPEGWMDYRNLLERNLISTQTLFGRSECLKQAAFDEALPRMQDWDYVIRLTRDFRVWYSPEVLADVYVQKDSISRKPELAVQAVRRLLWKYREDYTASEPLLNHMLDDLVRYSVQAESAELGETRERIDRLTEELQKTEMERNYYRNRVEALKNPVYGAKMLLRKIRKKKEGDEMS